jgi:hypothetical protein
LRGSYGSESIALALRFWHSFGLIHGRSTTNNIVFDSNHHVQITNLVYELSGRDISGFSGAGRNPKWDTRGFGSVLFEIIDGRLRNDEAGIRADIPMFLSAMIEETLSRESSSPSSFRNAFEILKSYDFRLVAGVDCFGNTKVIVSDVSGCLDMVTIDTN